LLVVLQLPNGEEEEEEEDPKPPEVARWFAGGGSGGKGRALNAETLLARFRRRCSSTA